MTDQRRTSFNPALIRRLLDNTKKNAPINTKEQNRTKQHTKQNNIAQHNTTQNQIP
jgi:hypothetical protein